MYTKILKLLAITLWVGSFPGVAQAFAIPDSLSLTQALSKSQYVVFAKITGIDTETSKPAKNQNIMAMATLLQPASIYSVKVLQSSGQKVSASLQLSLPAISSYSYGYANFHVETGDTILLFLKKNNDGVLVPVDVTRPLIPVTSTSELKLHNTDSVENQSQIIRLIIKSLSSPKFREPDAFLLEEFTDSQIVAGVFPYLDDPSDKVKDKVYYCLANNQQVAIIPRIAALDAKLVSQGSSAQSVTSLSNFKSPAAVPYLNPLLFAPSYYLRLNTMFALNRIADHTSIPYFLLALHDPDPQSVIPVSAYDMLHNIVPALGKPHPDSYYAQHRTQEIAKLYAWWTDELNGKHLQPGEALLLPKTLSDAPAQLNTMLFVAKASTRRAAAIKLSRIGDTTSIPYLIVALQDPDEDVAYSAYKTLHRLVPKISVPKSREDFSAGRSVVVQPIYDWWRDELLGKHHSS